MRAQPLFLRLNRAYSLWAADWRSGTRIVEVLAHGPMLFYLDVETKIKLQENKRMAETAPDNLNYFSFSRPSYIVASLLDDWKPGDRMLFVWNFQSGEGVFFINMPEDRFSDLIAINVTGEYIAYTSTVDERMLVDLWDQSTDSRKQLALFVSIGWLEQP